MENAPDPSLVERARHLMEKRKDLEQFHYPTGSVNCGALAEDVAELLGIEIDDTHWLRQLAYDVGLQK